MKRFLLVSILYVLYVVSLSALFAQSNEECQSLSNNVSNLGSYNEPIKPIFAISNFGFFDNREVHSPYQRSQTLFGTLLGAEMGVNFGPNTIMLGVHGIMDFGECGIAKTDFSCYYHYGAGRVSGAFGAFPRQLLHRELPDIFVYDSIRYYTPTLQGALLQYVCSCGSAELYCNWLNKQGIGEREIFEIVTDGRFGKKGYYLGWNIQLLHFSVPRLSKGYYVYDKLMINPHVGVEKNGIYWLDAYSIEAGLMLSLNRNRRDMIWKSPIGFLGDVKLRKGRFEHRDRLYVGNPQFSDYKEFGMMLHRGDPYYRSNSYNRTDINFYMLNRLDVQCFVNASFHYTERMLDNSQQVILRIFPKFL